MNSALEPLKQRLAGLVDLSNAAQLLDWDQQTMMPPRGSESRAEALATLHRITHETFISPDTGELLEAAQDALNGTPPDSTEARLVSVARRRWEKARRVSSQLTADLARARSLGQKAWVAARAESNFQAFAPFLERNLELAREYVACFNHFDAPYDALLDDYEPGMKSAEVARLFAELKAELVPLIATIGEHADRVDASPLHGNFPVPAQRELVNAVVRRMGFDPSAWRLDDAVHPFAVSVGTGDVRVTARWDETYFPSGLYAAMHECGHGLYEAGIDPALRRSPLGQIESLGLHESQSRMWENMVGRGRAFSGILAGEVGEHLGVKLDAENLYRAVNRISPSFIRVEADEATYGLHVILRFELEQALISGELSVADLPEAWNAKFHDYLGLEVPDDAHGVLQDVHWSAGLIGYFPTYALGNLIAGQLWDRASADVPDLDAQLAAGELGGLREWLREHVHRHGSTFTTTELLERVVGGPIAVAPFVSYLKAKLGEVYGLAL